MKEIPSLLLDTLDEVILRHTERYLTASNISEETHALRVRELILERTPARKRVASDFPLGEDLFHVQDQGGQKIRRWRNPNISARMSVGVLEAMVQALGEPYILHCKQELAQRMGGMFVPCPSGTAPEVTSVADFMREVGELLNSWATVAVGGINGEDDPAKLRESMREIDDVIAQAMRMRNMLEAALAEALAPRGAA
ncbi:hypothetical protein C3942_00760 [Solimonas fluminis]|uniref:Uncharacterized protein n=1 Tax=Solimonas fluminis TaxID=2086571 RepID=A0A2S5TKD8_9GAMM|nr:hypothetical protein [Solimonas fluminis]PPE75459.1 hypothetical protein C3942_00760 [Solimonas fluminis]